MNCGKDYTFCELKEKTVVNTVDGRRLGRIVDVAFTCTGQIFGLIVPENKRFFKNMASGDSIFIPWRNVCKIGDDIILVELVGRVNTLGVEDAPPS